MSKIDRRHKARQLQQNKHQDRVKASSIFSGAHGAPRNVAVISLTEDGDPRAAIQRLNESVDAMEHGVEDDLVQLRIERFKQHMIYMPVNGGLLQALDSCRVADFVLLVLSAQEEVDEEGQLLLKSIEGQGISNVFATVQVQKLAGTLLRQLKLTISSSGPRCYRPAKETARNPGISQIIRKSLLPRH
jgi:pre-rRNA-processing protein TSR1